MSTIEVEAKTLEEAKNQAAEQLGMDQDQLEIEILSDSSSKMFGLLGSSKVKIKATAREQTVEGDAQQAKEVLENILQRFGLFLPLFRGMPAKKLKVFPSR